MAPIEAKGFEEKTAQMRSDVVWKSRSSKDAYIDPRGPGPTRGGVFFDTPYDL